MLQYIVKYAYMRHCRTRGGFIDFLAHIAIANRVAADLKKPAGFVSVRSGDLHGANLLKIQPIRYNSALGILGISFVAVVVDSGDYL